jgi:membrane associated rhomboid family serine protease
MKHVPIAVSAIVTINVAAFCVESAAPHVERLISAFGMIPYDVANNVVLAAPSPASPYLTLVTSQFFHAGFAHLFFNMLFLAAFGPEVEFLCGPLRFVGLYLVCGIIGALAQISVGAGSHVPTIGASGAIAGVLGAYIVSFPRNRMVGIPAFLVIGLWAVTQIFNGFGALSPEESGAPGGTAYFAHIGGFVAGVFLIPVVRTRPA